MNVPVNAPRSIPSENQSPKDVRSQGVVEEKRPKAHADVWSCDLAVDRQ